MAETTECKHERIQVFRDVLTGEAVPLWSCVSCNRRFEPVQSAPAMSARADGKGG